MRDHEDGSTPVRPTPSPPSSSPSRQQRRTADRGAGRVAGPWIVVRSPAWLGGPPGGESLAAGDCPKSGLRPPERALPPPRSSRHRLSIASSAARTEPEGTPSSPTASRRVSRTTTPNSPPPCTMAEALVRLPSASTQVLRRAAPWLWRRPGGCWWRASGPPEAVEPGGGGGRESERGTVAPRGFIFFEIHQADRRAAGTAWRLTPQGPETRPKARERFPVPPLA